MDTHEQHPTLRVSRALICAREVTRLLGVTEGRIKDILDSGDIVPARCSDLGRSRKFDRHDVERLLAMRLDGDALDRARHELVELACDEIKAEAGKRGFKRTGTPPSPTSGYLSEDLHQLIVQAAEKEGHEPTRDEFDAWASSRGLGLTSGDLMFRLAEWSWRALVRRVMREVTA